MICPPEKVFISAQIPGYTAAILLIRRSEGVHKASLLLQHLQVEHDDGKDRKAERQQIPVHQQGTDIHEVKAEERRGAAETVNTGCTSINVPVYFMFFPP